MKTIQFDFDVHSLVRFTRDEVDALFDTAANHYDNVCKLAAQKGGFLHLARVLFEPEDTYVDISMSEYELQTLVKICEQFRMNPPTPYYPEARLVLRQNHNCCAKLRGKDI